MICKLCNFWCIWNSKICFKWYKTILSSSKFINLGNAKPLQQLQSRLKEKQLNGPSYINQKFVQQHLNQYLHYLIDAIFLGVHRPFALILAKKKDGTALQDILFLIKQLKATGELTQTLENVFLVKEIFYLSLFIPFIYLFFFQKRFKRWSQ